MPTLEWIGKEKVINHDKDVPFKMLDSQYTFDEKGKRDGVADSDNMIIHGDNLLALKALLPRYQGKVKCIYVDPPYNTGNEGWVYNDKVSDPQIKKWLGEVVGKEGEDLSRHDKWLCMMYPRLKLLQQLLSEDGAIFISIDDNEVYFLKSICDEIFGSNCFVARITWQNNYSFRNDAKGIPYETDNIVVYSKIPGWSPKRLPRTEEMDARYVNYDNDVVSYKVTPIHAPGASTHKGMVYAIQHPITGKLMYPPQGRHWKDGQNKLLDILCEWAPYELRVIDDIAVRATICGESVDENVPAIMLSVSLEEAKEIAQKRYLEHPWPSYFFLAKGLGSLQAKTYLDKTKGKVVSTLWRYEDVGTNVKATNEIKEILSGKQNFDTPKPLRLLERVAYIAANANDIVLDSFAGSGTTAHAVLSLNQKDNGNRKFILVEMMDYADSITAERVKRVICGYGEGDKAVPGTGGSFTYYELGETLFDEDGNLNAHVPAEKIREYVWYMETKLPLPILAVENADANDNGAFLGVCNHTAYYFHYDVGGATTLDHDFLASVKTVAESYVIYADACAVSEEFLTKHRITFKKIPRDIERL